MPSPQNLKEISCRLSRQSAFKNRENLSLEQTTPTEKNLKNFNGANATNLPLTVLSAEVPSGQDYSWFVHLKSAEESSQSADPSIIALRQNSWFRIPLLE